MSDSEKMVHQQLNLILDACGRLAASDDDLVKMYALRVDSLTRAFRDSVLVPDLPAGARA